ncbi:iron ABC transporter ATP-binding component [Erysipelotrichaceae bacterium]|nr:iron ABC transporter ATP-binding component [Erysipelotrichaceae bacterium]
MKDIVLKVEDLTVAYQNMPVLWDVDVSVPEGVLAAIIGPNGAGKSTLIKATLGLIKPLSGTVSFFGGPYKKNYQRIGYVPQKEAVNWDFPAIVLDVVTMGLYGKIGWFKRVRKSDRKSALAALKQIGMEEFAQRHISELSGGQQQRVFLARAIVQDADLYFMDEPFAGIDIKTEKVIIECLRAMRKRGKTVIVVHHDLNTVKEYFDYVLMVNKVLVASGPTETTFTPENIKIAFNSEMPLREEV